MTLKPMPRPRPVPTVRRRVLGDRLRQLRVARGLSTDEAAGLLGWSQSKVSRIENGLIKVSPSDVSDALDLYGVDSATRASLLDLAHKAQQRGWWTEYGDVFTGSYVGVEDDAEIIRVWDPQLIPGLLQTEDYARAVIEAGRPDDPADVDRRVRARRARQVLLTRETPPELIAFIAESTLRWPIGGARVIRAQLRALLSAAERSNVTLRVLPMAAGAHAGLDGGCVLLSFAEAEFPDVAYTAGMSGENYLESAPQVHRVTMALNRIADKTLSEQESVAFIAALVEE